MEERERRLETKARRVDVAAMKKPFESCCVYSERNLLDALRAIDAGGVGIALVIDHEGRLLSTLTDGDVRRALLSGAALETPLNGYLHSTFTAVSPKVGRAEVLDLMQSRTLHQVPIVDASGKVLGLHLLHEVIGAVKRSNWAVIMAGGRGTRLGKLTDNTPKPMIKVAGRPILERLVLHLVGFGIQRIFLSINYLGHVIEEHFQDGKRFGCEIEYLREEEPLCTGGALALLPQKPSDPLIVMNGDLVTQVNLDQMLAFHSSGEFVATMGVRGYSHQVPFGCAEVKNGRLTRLEEKPLITRWINAGTYVLSPQVVNRIPKKYFPITDLFEGCIERSESVGAFPIEGDWIDVGQREQLNQAREGAI